MYFNNKQYDIKKRKTSEIAVACTVSQVSLLISYETQMLEWMIGQADLNDSFELHSRFLILDS